MKRTIIWITILLCAALLLMAFTPGGRARGGEQPPALDYNAPYPAPETETPLATDEPVQGTPGLPMGTPFLPRP